MFKVCVCEEGGSKNQHAAAGYIHFRGIPNQLLPSTFHWQWPEKVEQGPGYFKVLTEGCYLCSVIMSAIETCMLFSITLLFSHANMYIADFCFLILSMSLLTCSLESQLLGWETKTTRCFTFHAEEVKLETIFLSFLWKKVQKYKESYTFNPAQFKHWIQ